MGLVYVVPLWAVWKQKCPHFGATESQFHNLSAILSLLAFVLVWKHPLWASTLEITQSVVETLEYAYMSTYSQDGLWFAYALVLLGTIVEHSVSDHLPQCDFILLHSAIRIGQSDLWGLMLIEMEFSTAEGGENVSATLALCATTANILHCRCKTRQYGDVYGREF